MAEQVEITNVGGANGVATEATLKLLLSAMDKMARATGKDSAAQQKVVKSLVEEFRARVTSTDAIEESTQAVEENTQAVEQSSEALTKMTNVLGTLAIRGIGALSASVFNIVKEFTNGSITLTDFAQHIPLVGGYLTLFTQYLDHSLSVFRDMSQVGASFGNSLVDLRIAAAEAQLTLDQFSRIIIQNTETLRLLGSTVSEGSQRFAILSGQLKRNEIYSSLRNLGFTIEDIDQGMANYISMQSMLGILERRNNASIVAGTQTYLFELDRLARVTGRSRRELEETMQRNAQDAGFRAIARSLEAQFGPDSPQLRNFNSSMALIDTLGGSAATALRDLADGVPQTDEAFSLIAAGGGELVSVMQQIASGANPQILLDALNSAGHRIEQFAGSGEDAAAYIQGIRRLNPILADILDYAFRMRQLGSQDLTQAGIDQAQRERITNAMANFENRIRGVISQLQLALIDHDVFEAAANAVEMFTDLLTNEQTMQMLTSVITSLSTAFAEFIEYLQNNDFSTIFEDIKTGLINGLSSIFTSPIIIGAIAGALTLAIGSAVAGALAVALAGSALGAGTAGLGQGVGAGAAGLGRGVGAGIGGIISGIGTGLAALGPMAPAIALGSAAVAAAIVTIGGAVAGATWMLGAALPTFAEGMKSFEQIDGDILVNVALGMTAIGGALAIFGAGTVVAGIGQFVDGIIGGIGRLFGAEDPMEKLERFAGYNIDVARVENNARALTTMSNVLAQASGNFAAAGISNFGEAIVNWLGSFFGEEDPMEKLERFANYDINVENVENNSRALRAFASALISLSGIDMSTFDLPNRFTSNLIRLIESSGTGSGVQGLAAGLTQIAEIANLREQLTVFDDLDTTNIDSYTNSIENLKNQLIELNEVLAESNDSWRTERLSAGELLQSVNLTNTVNAENIQSLNTTLLAILEILTENKEIDIQIERHTRRIGSSSDLSRGPISDIR